MRVDLNSALAPFVATPTASVVAVDFDGTLAPIVDEPAMARPLDGVSSVLAELTGRLGAVAVVSGRPVGFLVPIFPTTVTLAGLYGLEVVRAGRLEEHPGAEGWRRQIADIAATAERDAPAGLRVERKGLSLTPHYRGSPQLAEASPRLAPAWTRGPRPPVPRAQMADAQVPIQGYRWQASVVGGCGWAEQKAAVALPARVGPRLSGSDVRCVERRVSGTG